MKVYVVKANENWFCDRYHNEWCEYASEYNTFNPSEADVVWLLPSWTWRMLPPQFLSSKKVVATVHHIVPDKFDLRDFMERDRYVDCYHVPCAQTKNNISQYTKKPIIISGYWLNSDVWKPLDRLECRKELRLSEDDYIVGSFQRDTEGSDLASPKLEKGPDLFIEYIKKIKKDNLHVLLGGWRRQYIINRLLEEQIPHTYIKLAPQDTLEKMYASCNLYVVSARFEGGPQALLEAPAMNVPIVSTDVGMAKVTLSDNCIIDIKDDFYYPTEQDVKENREKVFKFEIKEHIKTYIKIFQEVL